MQNTTTNDEGSRRDAPQAMDDSERSHLDVSLSIRDLENSYRSGRGSGSFVLGESKAKMDDDAKEQQQQQRRRDVPIATPASHDDPNSAHEKRPDIRNRMSASVPLPMPTAAAAGTNHISPHTPMPPQVGIANRSTSVESPPPSTHSQNSQALAALYQSSRRSRGSDTPRSKEGVSIEAQGRLPPPPPLYDATPSSAEDNSLRGSFFPTHLGPAAREAERRAAVEEAWRLARSNANNDNNDDNDPHKISLQSSSGGLHDSWGTSMSSLMNSMNSNASFVYHASRSSMLSQGPHGLQIGLCQPTAPQGQGQGMQGRGGGGRPRQFPGAFGNLANFKFEDRRLSVESHDHSVHSLPGAGSRDSGQSEQLKNYKMEDDNHDHAHLTVPSLSDVSSEARGRTAPSPSMSNMGEQLSHLQVRSRDDFERRERSESTAMEEDAASNKTRESKRAADPPSRDEGEGADDRNRPSKKQNRRKSVEVQQDDERPQVERPQVERPQVPPPPDLDYLTPHTQKSTLSSASFDLIAHPATSRISSILSPEVSPLGDADVMDLHDIDAHADRERGRMQRAQTEDHQRQDRQDRGPPFKDPPGTSPLKNPLQAQVVKPDHLHEETASEKDQRIVRRKVERLLLIRHCSTCDVPNGPASVADILPPPPLVAGDESKEKEAQPSAPPVCPATSHCAEGKALCAHIRHCRDAGCKFKKCLTSREVLGHYKSCRDKYCEVCGPVRAADAKRRHRQKRRGSGDSSIETIDDEFWLNANMGSAHTMVDYGPEKEENR